MKNKVSRKRRTSDRNSKQQINDLSEEGSDRNEQNICDDNEDNDLKQ
jgi:hypothetical protein